MPAANSIANQDMVENSGFASAPPSRMLPTGSTIRARQNSTKMLPPTMNSQSKFSIDQPLAPSKASLAGSGETRVPITKTMISADVIQKTG
jgi:hypothetical protein